MSYSGEVGGGKSQDQFLFKKALSICESNHKEVGGRERVRRRIGAFFAE